MGLARAARGPSLAWALLALGCATAPAARPPEDAPRAVLERFTGAVDAGRWDEAYALLSPRWRARSTPARLAADLAEAGPAGRDAVARARAALRAGGAWTVTPAEATLAVGEGRSARLVREGDAWRVDTLE